MQVRPDLVGSYSGGRRFRLFAAAGSSDTIGLPPMATIGGREQWRPCIHVPQHIDTRSNGGQRARFDRLGRTRLADFNHGIARGGADGGLDSRLCARANLMGLRRGGKHDNRRHGDEDHQDHQSNLAHAYYHYLRLVAPPTKVKESAKTLTNL